MALIRHWRRWRNRRRFPFKRHEPCPNCGRDFGNIDAPHLIPGGDGFEWCVDDKDLAAFKARHPDAVERTLDGAEAIARHAEALGRPAARPLDNPEV